MDSHDCIARARHIQHTDITPQSMPEPRCDLHSVYMMLYMGTRPQNCSRLVLAALALCFATRVEFCAALCDVLRVECVCVCVCSTGERSTIRICAISYRTNEQHQQQQQQQLLLHMQPTNRMPFASFMCNLAKHRQACIVYL